MTLFRRVIFRLGKEKGYAFAFKCSDKCLWTQVFALSFNSELNHSLTFLERV